MSADLLNIPCDFIWKGSTHKVCIRDYHIEAVFGDWVRTQAALDLWKLRTKVPADFYREQMELYNSKLAGRQFEWGSEDVRKASWSESGQRQMLWLKIQRGVEKGGEPIERATIDEIATKEPAKWDELLNILYQQDYPDFFARIKDWREGMEAFTKPPSPPPSPAGTD